MDEQTPQKDKPKVSPDKDNSKKYVVAEKVTELRRLNIRNDTVLIQGDNNKQRGINIIKELNGGILLPLDDVMLLVSVTCPFCQAEIKPSDDVIQCKNCRIHHHLECWESYEGCTTLGCVYNHYLK